MSYNRVDRSLFVIQNKPLDAKRGPWASTAEACANIPINRRDQGLTVGIIDAGSIVEYWWKDGVEDVDLVAKSTGGGGGSVAWGDITGNLVDQVDLQNELNDKQDTLVSGTNIKTINSNSLLGSGDLSIHDLPTGGDAGQLLAKASATDYDVEWIDNYANWTSQLKHEVKLGEAISKGQAVYVSSADGTNMVVSKASNATEGTSSKTLGLLESGGSTNAKVKVITEGLLSGLNTATANAGDPVWLGTSGNLIFGLTNKPTAPAHLVFIGVVTRSNANNGEIFVKVQNGFELKEIHDVQAQSPNNKDSIFFDSADNQWKARAVSATDIDANVSNTEFSYLDGVTSSIQTQINALPRVVYTDYTAETTTSTSTTNALTTFGLTIADANWPLGGVLRLSGLMERTAGSGSTFMGVVCNGSTARYFSAGGQNMQWEWQIMKEAANTLRIGMGPSNTGSGSYAVHNQSTVTATASGGNYVFTFYMYVGTAGATASMRWMKGLIIP